MKSIITIVYLPPPPAYVNVWETKNSESLVEHEGLNRLDPGGSGLSRLNSFALRYGYLNVVTRKS